MRAARHHPHPCRYRGLSFDANSLLPAAVDAYSERGISLCGCSKSVGLPGIRVGWLASHDEQRGCRFPRAAPQAAVLQLCQLAIPSAPRPSALACPVLRRVMELKDYTTICNAAPSEVLALVALRAWDALLARQLGICRANVETLRAFFERWRGVMRWEPPQAGTMTFPRLLLNERVDRFCERLVADAGVLLLPASVYGHEPSTRQGRFRLGFGRRSMPRSLEQLEAYLQRTYPNLP